MLQWANSDGGRVAAYVAAGAVALVMWWREHRRRRTDAALWPTFWLLTAGFLLAMAVARVTDLGGLATALGREEAMERGWYGDRRRVQAIGAVVITGAWLVTVGIALWRVPARRRRYLPAALASFTLICFVAVRLISLHQIDAALYRRGVAGAQFGAVVELVLLGIVVLLTAFPPRLGTPRAPTRIGDLGRV